MKRFLTTVLFLGLIVTAWGQNPLDELKADLRKAYGTDYPYNFTMGELTPAPEGYNAFYISHYGRHGSRYYWNDQLYNALDTLLTTAHDKNQLTARGEEFFKKFMAAKKELQTGVSELTQLGWEQHQNIARTMYNRFPEVFEKGGDVFAIASLSGRCVLSMSAFCQELVQCNPKLEIREQSSRFTLEDVAPDEKDNPNRRTYPAPRPRYEQNRAKFTNNDHLAQDIIERVFTSTEGLPGNMRAIPGNLINLYTSLPNIGHEGMMGDIITDQEIANRWESSNLGSYTWVFSRQYVTIPILQDILEKADAAINGSSTHLADLRFGHDSYIGPLTVLMGLDGADLDPEDPYEVKNCYQSWSTCKASNIQIVFYRGSSNDDILIKCLLNGHEAKLPVKTDKFPYYKWSDVRALYLSRCNQF